MIMPFNMNDQYTGMISDPADEEVYGNELDKERFWELRDEAPPVDEMHCPECGRASGCSCWPLEEERPHLGTKKERINLWLKSKREEA
jgi:hypothetical protein